MPKIASVTQNSDESIQVNLDNKQGICFVNRAAVLQSAQDARRRVGIDGLIAIALIAAQNNGIEVRNVELDTAVRMELSR